MLQRLGRYPYAAIGDLEDELTRLLPRLDPHPATLGGELEGIRQEVVHHLVQIVGDEVHLHAPRPLVAQGDMAALGEVAVGLYDHHQPRRDVAAVPVGVADGGLGTCDVQQLVDEVQQALALALDDLHLVPQLRAAVGLLL